MAAQKNTIITNLLQDGLDGLQHMTDKKVRDVYVSYTKRTERNFLVILTPIQKQRIKSLILWVQDMDRVGEPLQFLDATTATIF